MAMSKRDRIGMLILIGLFAVLMVILYFTANEPIGKGGFFKN